MRQALDRAGRLGPLRAQLRREKTMRHLMGDSLELETTEPDERPKKPNETIKTRERTRNADPNGS